MHRSVKGAIIGFISFFSVGASYYFVIGTEPGVYLNYGIILGIIGFFLFAYLPILHLRGIIGGGAGFLAGFLVGALPSYNAGVEPNVYLLYGVILGIIGFTLGSSYANLEW